MRQLYAFLAKSSYATAPMSWQFPDGRPPDLTLEKTFDSYERRDHLRIWKLASLVDDVPFGLARRSAKRERLFRHPYGLYAPRLGRSR